MKEDLLHFIWKMKLFSSTRLYGIHNERISIKNPGIHNLNQGPDFKEAQIIIDDTLWVGHVEIHVNASDWYVHHHEQDDNYDQVVLHVVWNHDLDVYQQSDKALTTLQLSSYISNNLLERHEQLFRKGVRWINCEGMIDAVPQLTLLHWKERLFFERMEERANTILKLLKRTKNNWEATLFIVLAQNFGLKVNGEGFKSMAKSIDIKIIRKIGHDLLLLESLFFGQAGLLQHVDEPYAKQLHENYTFLAKKFKLTRPKHQTLSFFRLRPLNFPTIRLSQLASLYHKEVNLFSKFIGLNEIKEIYELFSMATSPFWETHYTFQKESKRVVKRASKSFVDLLLINTLLPIRYLYQKQMQSEETVAILEMMQELKPEKNSVISTFDSLGIRSKSAMDTQALLQLKNAYCDKGRCLSCAVGVKLLKG